MNWKEWFAEQESESGKVGKYVDIGAVEEMYQAFEARIMEKLNTLAVQASNTCVAKAEKKEDIKLLHIQDMLEVEKLCANSIRDELHRVRAFALRLLDAGEMLWVTLANVSGGNWNKQTEEWRQVAARWRDNWHKVAADKNDYDGKLHPLSSGNDICICGHVRTSHYCGKGFCGGKDGNTCQCKDFKIAPADKEIDDLREKITQGLAQNMGREMAEACMGKVPEEIFNDTAKHEYEMTLKYRGDRSHEECVDCVLEKVEPIRCQGHPQGPTSCKEFVEATRTGVHAAHCCKEHGCKYNEADCPVVKGLVTQKHPCEDCGKESCGTCKNFAAIFSDRSDHGACCDREREELSKPKMGWVEYPIIERNESWAYIVDGNCNYIAISSGRVGYGGIKYKSSKNSCPTDFQMTLPWPETDVGPWTPITVRFWEELK